MNVLDQNIKVFSAWKLVGNFEALGKTFDDVFYIANSIMVAWLNWFKFFLGVETCQFEEFSSINSNVCFAKLTCAEI